MYVPTRKIKIINHPKDLLNITKAVGKGDPTKLSPVIKINNKIVNNKVIQVNAIVMSEFFWKCYYNKIKDNFKFKHYLVLNTLIYSKNINFLFNILRSISRADSLVIKSIMSNKKLHLSKLTKEQYDMITKLQIWLFNTNNSIDDIILTPEAKTEIDAIRKLNSL